MTPSPMTAAQANALYEVLVEHAGAADFQGPHEAVTRPERQQVIDDTNLALAELKDRILA